MKITYRSLMFAFDVVIEHFFEWEHLIAILTCVFEFNAFSVHFHEMSPILKYDENILKYFYAFIGNIEKKVLHSIPFLKYS